MCSSSLVLGVPPPLRRCLAETRNVIASQASGQTRTSSVLNGKATCRLRDDADRRRRRHVLCSDAAFATGYVVRLPVKLIAADNNARQMCQRKVETGTSQRAYPSHYLSTPHPKNADTEDYRPGGRSVAERAAAHREASKRYYQRNKIEVREKRRLDMAAKRLAIKLRRRRRDPLKRPKAAPAPRKDENESTNHLSMAVCVGKTRHKQLQAACKTLAELDTETSAMVTRQRDLATAASSRFATPWRTRSTKPSCISVCALRYKSSSLRAYAHEFADGAYVGSLGTRRTFRRALHLRDSAARKFAHRAGVTCTRLLGSACGSVEPEHAAVPRDGAGTPVWGAADGMVWCKPCVSSAVVADVAQLLWLQVRLGGDHVAVLVPLPLMSSVSSSTTLSSSSTMSTFLFASTSTSSVALAASVYTTDAGIARAGAAASGATDSKGDSEAEAERVGQESTATAVPRGGTADHERWGAEHCVNTFGGGWGVDWGLMTRPPNLALKHHAPGRKLGLGVPGASGLGARARSPGCSRCPGADHPVPRAHAGAAAHAQADSQRRHPVSMSISASMSASTGSSSQYARRPLCQPSHLRQPVPRSLLSEGSTHPQTHLL
ncbi:hypothetical protein C8J57DRAFT_1257404 [Mycena rebaudengoi]|nr:hypothetical protein C8J57DRAFT_1257404 [Mycena rebaudengoi]